MDLRTAASVSYTHLDVYKRQTILREEAQLEDALRQKEHLLREVHHRTGNSLQLIASIMRMHMRQEQSDTARPILQGLHDRVMALATVHMGLYQLSLIHI